MPNKKVVYISGHYRGDGKPNTIHDNIEKARSVALEFWAKGLAVICPHTNTGYMDGACNDSVWLEGDIEILRRCDIIVMMPDWQSSEGAVAEWQEAVKCKLEIIYQ